MNVPTGKALWSWTNSEPGEGAFWVLATMALIAIVEILAIEQNLMLNVLR